MARTDKRGDRPTTIVVRREETRAAGHHGGAWKVAYADFVTAMMAFFLLMWLLNATTEEQRKGLADYFSPSSEISRNHAGSGLPFGGKTAFEDGALVSERGAVRVLTGLAPTVDQEEDDDTDTIAKPRVYRRDGDQTPAQPTDQDSQGGRQEGARTGGARDGARTGGQSEAEAQAKADARADARADAKADAAAREKQLLEAAAEQIRQSVQADPALAAIARQLVVEVTPEGLRVQILDDDQQPMFATGAATPNERARMVLQKVGPVIARLRGDVAVAGHTDAAPFPGPERTNWELSAERATSTRRLLIDAGLPAGRIREVTGDADRDPLVPSNPMAAANRRIAITVRRDPAPAGGAP